MAGKAYSHWFEVTLPERLFAHQPNKAALSKVLAALHGVNAHHGLHIAWDAPDWTRPDACKQDNRACADPGDRVRFLAPREDLLRLRSRLVQEDFSWLGMGPIAEVPADHAHVRLYRAPRMLASQHKRAAGRLQRVVTLREAKGTVCIPMKSMTGGKAFVLEVLRESCVPSAGRLCNTYGLGSSESCSIPSF